MDKTSSTKDQDNFTFRRSHFYSILVVLAFAAGILIGYVAWGRSASAQTADNPLVGAPVATSTPHYVRYNIPTEGSPSIGPEDAPIVIVEFSDYQCPYCKKWHDETYQPLLAAYPGKIRLVYRNYPLPSHANAFPAAEAAMCAGEQNAYWPFHDKLFTYEYDLGEETYQKYAAELGLDMATLNDCLTNHRYNDSVQGDVDFASNLGIQSTPTFFINGLAVVGAQPLDLFKRVIDKELAGEILQ